MSQYRSDKSWPSLRDKIESRLDKTDPNGCWLWTRATSGAGYGQVAWHGTVLYVHRAYLSELGFDLPAGMDVDHLCRVPLCANPDHLEIVTHRENVLRGVGQSARNAAKTHCKRGHEFTSENTYVDTKGQRRCRICTNRVLVKRT